MELRERHKEVLRHMLGIEKYGDKPWRNYFVASEGHNDMPALNDLLVADYVAVRNNPSGSGYLFMATDKGRSSVGAEVRHNDRVQAGEASPATTAQQQLPLRLTIPKHGVILQ